MARLVAVVAVVAAECLSLAPRAQAQSRIANTVHNLTPSGPGRIKETQPAGLCVFCHTPHDANPQRALWNRDAAATTYQPYTSSSLVASSTQPTGSSRLCLSCHDGLLALGNIRVSGGLRSTLGPMTGSKVLGTDLSRDHPVSIVYDSTLAARSGKLADPAALPRVVRLDHEQRVQCTSCHDPHDDRWPRFLRMDDANGALCTACHQLPQWSASSHATSRAVWKGSGPSPLTRAPDGTLASSACYSCHRTHSARHGERLLAWPGESENCNVCHSGGTMAAKDIGAEFLNSGKFSRHPVETAEWTHAPGENPLTMARHVACVDCHNPHASTSASGGTGALAGTLQGVAGVDLAGARITAARYDYEICTKCHDRGEPTTRGATRVDATRNVRLRISPANASYHPIAAIGRNPSMSGLLNGLSASSTIGCTDCHGNSDPAPRGAHASRFAPILQRNYVATDRSAESPATYDVCYKCHDRTILFNERAGRFPHREHVVESQASCAVCHDAHGSRSGAHLIDFLKYDAAGRLVVTPSSSGRLEYTTTATGRSACYLTCHGEDHNPQSY